MLVTSYRIIGVLADSMMHYVEFEGSLDELRARYPVDLFPKPIFKWVEDVWYRESGSLLYRLEVATAHVGTKQPVWQPCREDPRFAA